MRALMPEFTFAGFTFPRYIPEIIPRRKDGRTFEAIYTHAPTPLCAGMTHPGKGFYLEDHGSLGRWTWCDEVSGSRVDHSGWYSDEYGCLDKIRGIVFRLPHGRFLAGWSMGDGMATSVDGDIYTGEIEAARAADSIAENAAETEREYQEQESERIREEEERQEECEGGDAEEIEGY